MSYSRSSNTREIAYMHVHSVYLTRRSVKITAVKYSIVIRSRRSICGRTNYNGPRLL